MIIGTTPTKEQIIETGMDFMVQCITFDADIQEITTRISLNILGVVYSVDVPTHELSDPNNVKSAWRQLIRDFGVYHLMGQDRRVQDGHRDLTEEESKVLEESKSVSE